MARDMKWYVIFTKMDEEIRALKNLEVQVFNFFGYIPSSKKSQGKVKLVIERLFNSYLFTCYQILQVIALR